MKKREESSPNISKAKTKGKKYYSKLAFKGYKRKKISSFKKTHSNPQVISQQLAFKGYKRRRNHIAKKRKRGFWREKNYKKRRKF